MSGYLEKYGQTFVTLAAIIAAFVGLVTINGYHFDAQDKRFDAHDKRFDAQDQRFDAQDRLNGQFFQLVNQRLDAQDRLVNQRFDAQDQRLDRLTEEVSELRRLMAGIGERVSRNEGAIDVIRDRLRIADTPSP